MIMGVHAARLRCAVSATAPCGSADQADRQRAGARSVERRRPYRPGDDAYLLLSASLLMLAGISAVGGLCAFGAGDVPVPFAVAPAMILSLLAGGCFLTDVWRGRRRRRRWRGR